MPLDEIPSLAQPRDAAQWFARMHSGEVMASDRQAFAAWCEADPRHEQEYRALVAQWHAARVVPEATLRRLMNESPMSCPPESLSRRRLGLAFALACPLTIVGGLLTAKHLLASDPVRSAFSTRQGERRQVDLAEGSTLHLNVDTRLAVQLDARERRIILAQGEAFFDVQHDSARPFVVMGGAGRITVTGTRFNVRRDDEDLQVSVESGSVRLAAGPWWQSSERRLSGGQQATAYPDQSLSGVAQINVENLIAWKQGKIVFHNEPLARVIREMNRYLPQPARLDATELGARRISGVFNADDPLAMIDALPAIAPVRVQRSDDGRVRVVAR